MYRYSIIICLLFGGVATAKYPIKTLDPSSKRAVIAIGDRSTAAGDVLELIGDSDGQRCKVKVLKLKKQRALISTKKCTFKVAQEHRVTDLDVEQELLSSDVSDGTGLAANKKKIELGRGQYIGGGAAGTILGLGIGHAIQGRWLATGWKFTVSEFLFALLYVTEVASHKICTESETEDSNSCQDRSKLWELLLAGTRIAEIVSVWYPDSDEYKIVSERPRKQFFAAPIWDRGQVGLSLTMTF